MLTTVLCALLLGLCDHSWEGVYRVNGANPDGSTYGGAVQVTPIPNTALYDLVWLIDGQAETPIGGIGFEQDGRLVVTGRRIALFASYRRDGRGLWWVGTTTRPMPERWRRVRGRLEDTVRRGPAAQPAAAGAAV